MVSTDVVLKHRWLRTGSTVPPCTGKEPDKGMLHKNKVMTICGST